MSNPISLEGSIRTCKIDTAYANKIQSDRFLNSNNMLCPPWNGVDTSGRPVCWDSYFTKTPGCNSASDRVVVENGLRPQYIEYVNLDAAGIRGGSECPENAVNDYVSCSQKRIDSSHQQTGQYGLTSGFGQYIYPDCTTCRVHPDKAAAVAQQQRRRQFRHQAGRSQQNRQMGFHR